MSSRVRPFARHYAEMVIALVGFEHVAMLGGMLAAMVLRLDEYTGNHARAAEVRA